MATQKQALPARLGQILLWSVISAAFIGPGTVTTAASAGASHGASLAWALVFSTLGCIVLQEAAARLSIAGGVSLGQALPRGGALVVGAVAFGCVAYEAGNLVGAHTGLALAFGVPRWASLVALTLTAALLLGFNRHQGLAKVLGSLVLALGAAFLILAFRSPVSGTELLRGAFIPSIPAGSSLLIIGLVGTTIVPYNLFLGNGIGKPEDGLGAMRFGLIISVALGGLFSLAILMVGAGLEGDFSFEALKVYLGNEWGPFGQSLLAVGLFIAGLTSSLTAPFAAGLAVQSLLPAEKAKRGYTLTWALVLAVGLAIGLQNVKVVPLIIAAQALNGFVLPVVAGFLFWAVNQPQRMGKHVNQLGGNILFAVVFGVSLFLGLDSLVKAIDGTLDSGLRGQHYTLVVEVSAAALITLILAWKATQRR